MALNKGTEIFSNDSIARRSYRAYGHARKLHR